MGELAPHLDGFVARATKGRAAIRYPLVHVEAANLSPGVLGARLTVTWDEHSTPQAYHVWIHRQNTGASPSAGSGPPAEAVGRDEHAEQARRADELAVWRASLGCMLPLGRFGRYDWGGERERKRDCGAGDDDAA